MRPVCKQLDATCTEKQKQQHRRVTTLARTHTQTYRDKVWLKKIPVSCNRLHWPTHCQCNPSKIELEDSAQSYTWFRLILKSGNRHFAVYSFRFAKMLRSRKNCASNKISALFRSPMNDGWTNISDKKSTYTCAMRRCVQIKTKFNSVEIACVNSVGWMWAKRVPK